MTESARSSNPAPAGKSGFTLIELLTVIAIIGILAAILIPVVQTVRESARATQCMNMVRQWGMAIILYAEDHDGTYAVRADEGVWAEGKAENWASVLAPYREYLELNHQGVRDWRICPSYALNQDLSQGNVTYAMVQPTFRGSLTNRARIPLYGGNPSELMIFIDAAPQNDGLAIQGNSIDQARTILRPPGPRVSNPYDRHGDRYNAVFGDGHARRLIWGAEDSNDNDSIAANWDRWFEVDRR